MFVVSTNYTKLDVLVCAPELFTKYTKARQMFQCEKEYFKVAETKVDYGKCACHSPCTEYVHINKLKIITKCIEVYEEF